MNPSNLYEQYFAGISRRIKAIVVHEVDLLGGLEQLSDDSVNMVFEFVLNGISIFQTEQHAAYAKASVASRREILAEIYNRECYIYYKVSSTRRPYEVVQASIGTMYEPVGSKFLIQSIDQPEARWSENKVIIAPQYIILLAKTPEQYLATSSAKTNHYDLPVSVGPRMRQTLPYRNSPVKILSETETRLYSSYVGRKGLAELKDRANSVETHKLVYQNILNAEKPGNIDSLVDRNVHPFGTDKAIELTESILNVSGIKLVYVNPSK